MTEAISEERCTINCDPDCTAVCHSDHEPGHKKTHWPWDCPAADRYDWGSPFNNGMLGRLRSERGELLAEVEQLRSNAEADWRGITAALDGWNEEAGTAWNSYVKQRVRADKAEEELRQARAENADLRAQLAAIGETQEEWGQKYSGGGYLTRVDSDWMRKRWPVGDWVRDNTRGGGVVGRRRIIVVEDWQDFREGEWRDVEQESGDA